MNFLVIGHSVADIIDFNEIKILKAGGIFYSILALNNFKENQDKISLVTAVDKKYYFLFNDEYKKLYERLYNYVESIPLVHLKIEKESERHETYENINQNLVFNIQNLNSFDGILINMITGFDITLDQLRNIRKNYEGLIYFDVHTLSRGVDENMHRHFRVIPQFNEWAENVDFLQVNEHELFSLSKKTSKDEIINEVFGYGIKFLILTLEDKGVKLFYKDEGTIKTTYKPAIKIDVKNKVGCGDVFGAVFFYTYISQQQKNIDKVLENANTAAACAASYKDLNEYKNLKNDVFTRLN